MGCAERNCGRGRLHSDGTVHRPKAGGKQAVGRRCASPSAVSNTTRARKYYSNTQQTPPTVLIQSPPPRRLFPKWLGGRSLDVNSPPSKTACFPPVATERLRLSPDRPVALARRQSAHTACLILPASPPDVDVRSQRAHPAHAPHTAHVRLPPARPPAARRPAPRTRARRRGRAAAQWRQRRLRVRLRECGLRTVHATRTRRR